LGRRKLKDQPKIDISRNGIFFSSSQIDYVSAYQFWSSSWVWCRDGRPTFRNTLSQNQIYNHFHQLQYNAGCNRLPTQCIIYPTPLIKPSGKYHLPAN